MQSIKDMSGHINYISYMLSCSLGRKSKHKNDMQVSEPMIPLVSVIHRIKRYRRSAKIELTVCADLCDPLKLPLSLCSLCRASQ